MTHSVPVICKTFLQFDICFKASEITFAILFLSRQWGNLLFLLQAMQVPRPKTASSEEKMSVWQVNVGEAVCTGDLILAGNAKDMT